MTSIPRENIFICGMSRSGTTLLTTVLDSHPDVSMGYELLPADLPTVPQMMALLSEKIAEYQDDVPAICKALKQENLKAFATFVNRCYRTNVLPQELLEELGAIKEQPTFKLDTNQFPFRIAISKLVVDKKRQKEGTIAQGFKINAPGFEQVHKLLPSSTFIYILRDPRDVVASHIKRGFDRTVPQIIKAWRSYLENFIKLQKKYPEQTYLIRYEDLVADPDRFVKEIVEACGLPFVTEVREFFRSKASVHTSGHANTEELSQDFFTSSIGRWKQELDIETVHEIERLCGKLLEEFRYRKANTAVTAIARKTVEAKRKSFIPKRKFNQQDYHNLIEEHRQNRVNLTWHEAVSKTQAHGEDVFLVRHDIDHDIETALRMAQWEHQHNIRATYCVLHTAWYYGEFHNGRYTHYDLMVENCKKIQDLGHEINFHNNLAVLALQTGYNPFEILEQELEFFSLHGIRITGTSTHGDRLCRDLDFRNYELFAESVYESRGGVRTVAWEHHKVTLGSRSMKEFGLLYEGYDLPRDVYVTDSGGNLRVIENTKGRAGLRRSEMEELPYKTILGVLTHPIWWDL